MLSANFAAQMRARGPATAAKIQAWGGARASCAKVLDDRCTRASGGAAELGLGALGLGALGVAAPGVAALGVVTLSVLVPSAVTVGTALAPTAEAAAR